MSNSILFIFEGERTESRITNNLTHYFVNGNTNVQCAFCADVYQLYKMLCDDPDLDTFALLKSRAQNHAILSGYSRNDFAEIYLFFDYDGHATGADDNAILDLALFFDEETEAGKIYFSYPMVEALKHFSPSTSFKDLKVIANTNIGYKGIVAQEGATYLQNLNALTENHWKELIEANLKKMHFIVNDSFALPTVIISQEQIFTHQKSKFIDVDSTVSVLSAFPIFIFDYYGYKWMMNLLNP